MTKVKRSVTISTELDEIIAMLAVSKGMNYSEFLESRLRMNQLVAKKIQELEELPEIPITEITSKAVKKSKKGVMTKLAKQGIREETLIEV